MYCICNIWCDVIYIICVYSECILVYVPVFCVNKKLYISCIYLYMYRYEEELEDKNGLIASQQQQAFQLQQQQQQHIQIAAVSHVAPNTTATSTTLSSTGSATEPVFVAPPAAISQRLVTQPPATTPTAPTPIITSKKPLLPTQAPTTHIPSPPSPPAPTGTLLNHSKPPASPRQVSPTTDATVSAIPTSSTVHTTATATATARPLSYTATKPTLFDNAPSFSTATSHLQYSYSTTSAAGAVTGTGGYTEASPAIDQYTTNKVARVANVDKKRTSISSSSLGATGKGVGLGGGNVCVECGEGTHGMMVRTYSMYIKLFVVPIILNLSLYIMYFYRSVARSVMAKLISHV